MFSSKKLSGVKDRIFSNAMNISKLVNSNPFKNFKPNVSKNNTGTVTALISCLLPQTPEGASPAGIENAGK